jgi:hypothetical protein
MLYNCGAPSPRRYSRLVSWAVNVESEMWVAMDGFREASRCCNLLMQKEAPQTKTEFETTKWARPKKEVYLSRNAGDPGRSRRLPATYTESTPLLARGKSIGMIGLRDRPPNRSGSDAVAAFVPGLALIGIGETRL